MHEHLATQQPLLHSRKTCWLEVVPVRERYEDLFTTAAAAAAAVVAVV